MHQIVIENDFIRKYLGKDRVLLIPKDTPDAFLLEKNMLCKYIGAGGTVVLPNGITGIHRFAFLDDGKRLKSVTLPNSMTRIGRGTFRYLEELESVTLSDSVTEIEAGAFCGCIRLREINVPKHARVSGIETFRDCHALADPDGFVIVNGILFDYIGSNTNVTVPDGVRVIGVKAFTERRKSDNDRQIVSVTIPNGVTRIEAYAFDKCESLASVMIPKSVSFIGRKAFADCPNLKRLAIPASAAVEGEAFSKQTHVFRY